MPATETEILFRSGDRVQGYGDRVPKVAGYGPYGTVVGNMAKGTRAYIRWDTGQTSEHEAYEIKKLSSGSPGKFT